MKIKRISIFCIIFLAISLVLFSAIGFAEIKEVNTPSNYKQLTLQDIDINNIQEIFTDEYVNQYQDQEIRLIVKFNRNVNSLEHDLNNKNVNCVTHNTFTKSFFGQSITIKIKDVLSLSSLNYVESVNICNQYYSLSDYSAISNTNRGIFNNDTTYLGEGMVACIIDNAFDTSHSAFNNISGNLAINVDNLASMDLNAYTLSGVSPEEVYLSNKIPFAYDYAENDANLYQEGQDHGTHVAGIVAANNDTIKGVVPDAQLALMKVGDSNGNMYTDTILRALEDCKALNVDIVNMSLGSSSGFAYNEDDILYSAIEELRDIGIIIVCAAGNSYTAAFGATNGDLALNENIDNASISSPASYTTTTSIANAEESNYVVLKTRQGNNEKLVFADGYNTKTNTYGNYFNELANISSQLQYVLIENSDGLLLGKQEDYINFNVTNRIAVVQRGEITFTEKLENARKAGAIGLIVVNTSQSFVTASLEKEGLIPFAMASSDALVKFQNNAINHVGTLIFDDQNRQLLVNSSSSRGVLEDLSLGVDYAAFGTNIYSLGLNQSYQEMTGTSMASPNAAGAVIALKQFVKQHKTTFNATTNKEIAIIAEKLIMSNTSKITDLNDVIYSPRVQGAGLINLQQAISSGVYISVAGQDKTKIELKDNLGATFTLEFTIVNTTNENKTYYPNVKVLTEEITEDNLMSGLSRELSIRPLSISSITVNANSQKTIAIDVTLTDETIALLSNKDIYPAGTYVDGYIILSGNQDISCPFLGFWGDWDAINMLDATNYEVAQEQKEAQIRASTSYGIYAGAYYVPMGEFAYKVDEEKEDLVPTAKREYASLSVYSSAMYSLGYIQLGLLRNAKYISIQVIDTITGKVIYESDTSYVGRTAYLAGYSMMYGGDIFEDISPYSLNLENNKQYVVKVDVYREYNEESLNNTINATYEQPFTVDFEAPVITDINYSNNNTIANLTIYDNNYAQALLVCTGKGTTATNVSLYVEEVHPLDMQKGEQKTISIDISDALSNATNGYLYYYVVDYAFNYSIYYDNSPISSVGTTMPNGSNTPSTNTGLTTTNFKFIETSIEIQVNETRSLATKDILVGYDIKEDYTWNSSDRSIVNVCDGQIFGLQEGLAVIEVIDNNNNKSSIVVNVKGQRQETITQFDSVKVSSYNIISSYEDQLLFKNDVESKNLKFAPNEAISFNVSFEPFNYNYISHNAVVSVESEATYLEVEKNMVRAISAGSGATIDVYVSYTQGSLLQKTKVASYNVEVVSLVHISDERVLEACFIQDEIIDFTTTHEYDFIAIAANAFMYAKNVETIILPDSCTVIYDNAFKDSVSLTTIDLKNTKAVYKNAFKGCVSLKQIDLSNVELLSEDAFNGCVNLKTVKFSDGQLGEASISFNAFTNCDRLQSFTIGTTENIKTIIVNNKLLYTLDYLDALSRSFSVIGPNSFRTVKISEIDLSNKNIERIEKEAFKDNEYVTKLKFNNTKYIGPNAFNGCSNLKSITFTNNTSNKNINISDSAFAYAAIETIDFSGLNTTFKDFAFLGCDKLKYVNLGVVEDIGRYTFALANDLSYVKFEEGSKKVGENTFALAIIDNNYYYHDALRVVEIPNSITTIDEYAFAYCTNLDFSKINLSNVEHVKEGAFYGCTINVEIKLPAVKEIAYGAFAESSINSIQIAPNTNETLTIGELAFYRCDNLKNVYLPTKKSASVEIKRGAFYECSSLTSESYFGGINLDRAVSIDEFAFTRCTSLTALDISSVTYIGYGAFAECEKLEQVYINSLEEINDYAFYACNLQTITIPTTIKYIGQSVFNNNENILIKKQNIAYEGVTFDTTSDGMLVIYNKLDDGSLALVYYPYLSEDESYTILNNTKIIATYAFYGAKLKSVAMNDVSVIGHGAFFNCENLTAVEIKGALPILASLYNDDATNTYCNFVNNIDEVEGLILICSEDQLENAKSSYIYSTYFDEIVTSIPIAPEDNLTNFVDHINKVDTQNITKEVVQILKNEYALLSEEELEVLNNEYQDVLEKYNSIIGENQETDTEKKNTINPGANNENSFLTMEPVVVIPLIVVGAILFLTLTTFIAWGVAARTLKKREKNDNNKKE